MSAGGTERNAQEVVVEQAQRQARKDDLLRQDASRAGGAYVPPFKLAEMRKKLAANPSSEANQRMQWDALRKSINGLVNKVNTTNMKNLVPELFSENLVRARGLVCRSTMKAQMASPNFTHVYAALIAVLNTKMPEIGELLLKRVIMQFRRAFRRNDKLVTIACCKFIAHLVNQQVAHEVLALQLCTLLLTKPTDDSVEIAVDFIKEVGTFLSQVSPRGMHGIFERLRAILQEGQIDIRTQYMIEGLFLVRKGKFADYPSVLPELDLVESDDQITHDLRIDGTYETEKTLDIFQFDPNWEENERQYAAIKKEILGDEEEEEEDASDADADDDADEDSSDDSDADTNESAKMVINDQTDADVINLRRTIYLTIMSSLDFEECAHKLLKIDIKAGQEKELCNMIIECCSKERSYNQFYGQLGERFCNLKRDYQDQFDEAFATQYAYIHRYETNRLRNIAKFFAHLLYTDALDWGVMSYIRLTEQDTTSSSRIFIKILMRGLSELMGMSAMKARLEDPFMAETFSGLFPRDNPKNMRFSINFFTSIGLGGLTESLRNYLKNAPKQIMAQKQTAASDSDSDSDSSSDSSSSSSSSSSSDSDSSSDSSSSDSSDSEDESAKRKAASKKKESRVKAEVKEEKGAAAPRGGERGGTTSR